MKFILAVAIVWLSVASVSITAICVSHNPKWALLMLIPACLVSIKQKGEENE